MSNDLISETNDLEDLLASLVEDVEDFLTNTEEARVASERARDYKDHKQWTAEEKAIIEGRGQAAIVVNRIKPKVEGLKGLLINRKTDPKAYARTPKHEKAAEAVTDALRYVADNVDFDKIKLEVAENDFVEGYGAAIVDIKKRGKELEIDITTIPWDRYYFDNYSRRLDFRDKRWDGMILWMDADEVREKFKLSKEKIIELMDNDNNNDDGWGTFDDRPQWVDRKKNRIRICQHFFIKDEKWHKAYFTRAGFLPAFKGQKEEKPIVSPYKDEFGEPVNPIVAVSANIDRENNRFGEVHFWLDLQDEINHRRSKFLHLLSVRQTEGRKGAIRDIPAMKRELSKADGHVEWEGEKGEFNILKTGDMAEAQFTLYQDGKAELDAVGFNAQLSGERQGDLSGKAISNLQDAATNELSSLFAGLTDWEVRVYRQIWFRVKQFWNAEKWIRVTDDTTKLRYIGLNEPITLQQKMEEAINDNSLFLPERQEIAQQLQQMQQMQHPALQEISEVRNPIAELDMDIILTTSPDSINIQREQFELLANIAQTRPEIPFTELLKLSELRDKDKIIKNIEAQTQQAQQKQQGLEQRQLQIEDATVQGDLEEQKSKTSANQSKGRKDAAATVTEAAKADKLQSEADQVDIQSDLLLTQPPKDSGVVI